MSFSEEDSVTCPQCGNTQPFTVWRSVNVSLDPELSGRFLDGTLTLFTCEKCGDSGRVPYNPLHHDMEQKVMFQLRW